MSRARSGVAAVVLAASVAGAGCVDRRIFITSEPSGARVYLNDQDVGLTPLEVNFTWFGTYDVRLRKAGYEPLITTREAKAPLHEVPPFDFVALAVPGTKRTHIDWHFELAPVENDPAALLERATALRREVEDSGSEDAEPADSPDLAPAMETPEAPPAPTPAPSEPVGTTTDTPDVREVVPATTPSDRPE